VIVPDVNLLLYAYDSASPFHERARQWWSDCLSGAEPVGLTHPVLFAFVRISTSARAYDRPLRLEHASAHVMSWLTRRVVRVLQPDENHVATVLTLLAEAGSSGGNLVSDAQLAALAIAHRATVHTADHDFARFVALKCHYPLRP
jgi:uncharacterized protein